MFTYQTTILLKGRKKGCYLITSDIQKEIAEQLQNVNIGTCHIFLPHTSASISINENADPSVRSDMVKVFTKMVPHQQQFEHDYEGSDDMTAHGLSNVVGCDITVPIKDGVFLFGTWQGIYLNEHRNFGGDRKVIITIMGSQK